MFGNWLVVIPLLLVLNKVTLKPITSDLSEDSARSIRQIDPRDCCPCLESTASASGARSRADGWMDSGHSCQPCAADAEAASSIILPALRAIQPFVKQAEEKSDPKPLLQPEVGLASSVLETLRQATDEEYQDALARDAARSAAKLFESSLDPLDDTLSENPKKIVKIFLNPKADDMDDNLPEQSHVQETRCIHPQLQSVHRNEPLIFSRPTLEIFQRNEDLKLRRPTPIIEVYDTPRKPVKKLKNKGLLHRNIHDMDNGIGASNIQERVIQPTLDNGNGNSNFKSNPALFSLFGNNMENSEDSIKNSKPNINFKLRELIENLQMKSDKEKSKLPTIDIKKYFSTSTRIPPLQFKPIEKSVYSKPLLLKDILKLKDVELIPRKELTKKVAEESLYPNLKLQSENSKIKPVNDNYDNMKTKPPSTLEIGDADLSPSNTKSVFDSTNNQANSVIKQNFQPAECVSSSEINDINLNQPIDLDSENNYDDVDIGNMEDPNSEQLLLDDCGSPTESLTAQNVPNIKNQNQGLNVNGSQKEKAQKFKDDDDMLNEQSNNNAFQIQFVEDLDLPIEFDNSSFIQNSELETNNEFQNVNSNDAFESTLNDQFGNTSSDDVQIEESNEIFDNNQGGLENKGDNCITQQSSSPNSNLLSGDQISEINNQESMEEEPLEDNLNSPGIAREALSDINDDPSKVSFKDLQDMSDSLLRESDVCKPLIEQVIENTNNLNTISEINSEETSDVHTNLDSEDDLNKALDLDTKENLCHTLTSDDTSNTVNKIDDRDSLNSPTDNLEMTVAASEPESRQIIEKKIMLDNSPPTLFRNIVDDVKNKKTFTKPTTDLSNILQKDTRSEFLDSLQSKLNNLFRTSDKPITNNVLNGQDDNINESSNTNPVTAKFNKILNVDKLQRTPQSLLSQVSPFKTAMPLDSYKNKLTLPKYTDLTNDRQNFLKFPLEVTSPLENVLDPGLNFAAFTDKLRSHTENTLQNVKETLESTVKDSQSFRIGRPTEIFDTHDVLESLTNKHDDMKEKLEALHLDFNDRISTFQQSIKDHFNQPLGRISAFQEESSHEGMSSNFVPVHKESLALPKVKSTQNVLTLRENALNKGRKTDISIKSPNIYKTSDAPHLRNSNSKPTLQNPVTTTIPSFKPRPKVLKTNLDLTPKLNHETLSKTTASKMPSLLHDKVSKSGRTNNVFEKSPSSSNYGSSSRNNFPLKINKNNLNNVDLSEENPVNKLRKALLERAQKQKSRNELTIGNKGLGISNNLLNSDANVDSSSKKELLLSHNKQGKSMFGFRKNSDMVRSPTTQIDNTHPAQLEEGLRLVEPMKENVPYKCKLICYRDT